MLVKRLIAALLICTLLAGCATKPNGDYDVRACNPGAPNGNVGGGGSPGDVLVGIAVVLIVEGLFVVGCITAVEIGNGWRHYHPATSDGAFYLPPDKSFSVAIPVDINRNLYEVREKPAPGRDSVLFLPSRPTTQDPVFGVAELTDLDQLESTESLEAFAQQITTKLPGLMGSDAHPQQLYAGNFAVDDTPMHLVIYQQTHIPGQDQAYQLLYFVRDEAHHQAAVLSVTWPQACAHCTDGPESAIRSMDPRLGSFVESFRFDTSP